MSNRRGKKDVAWVTCRDLPEPDPDEAPALEALRNAGLTVHKLAWDDARAASPSESTACVLRSCWNYYERPSDFAAWIDRAAADSTLLNPREIVHWNLHKRYLGTLEENGVPIVPTVFLTRGAEARIGSLLDSEGWEDVVLKPAVSAGSFSTARFRRAEAVAAQSFLDAQLTERDMLVQCFVPAVETTGEKCMVWIDGDFTHAVIKQPRFSDDDECVSAAIAVDGEHQDLGLAAMEVACKRAGVARSELLYARVDIVEHAGKWVIGELELLEPSLFLSQSPQALERFVEALTARCR